MVRLLSATNLSRKVSDRVENRYHQYPELVKTYGKETAHEIIKFQVSHVHKLLSVAEEDGLLEDSQCRLTDSFDAYVDRTRFEIARENYTEYRKEEELSSLHQVTRLYEDKEQLQVSTLLKRGSRIILISNPIRLFN